MKPIELLLSIMARLRDPKGGCPWDLEQTFETISPYTIEEAYEVDDAIQRKNYEELKEELGDLLFQVVFHSQMAAEKSYFDFQDVATEISAKMIRRHPHLFSDGKSSKKSGDVETWESIKAEERQRKSGPIEETSSILDGIAGSLPALTRSGKLQKRASLRGFDWPDITPVLGKVSEELKEVHEVLSGASNIDRLADEIGDLLFSCVNLARHCEVDPEQALRRANQKFERRFRRLESLMEGKISARKRGSLEELQNLWEQVKSEEPG